MGSLNRPSMVLALGDNLVAATLVGEQRSIFFSAICDEVVCEVLYEERLPTTMSTFDEVEARADVTDIVKDALLLVIEVNVPHFKRNVETTNVEGLCIFCHWDIYSASNISSVVRVQVGMLQKNLVD
jgi:hypothetical protein